MKKTVIIFTLLMSVIVSACAESNTLVACFSVTGNTAPIAHLAAEALSADYYEIIPEIPYSAADIQYTNNDCRANLEQADDACRPEIAEPAIDMDKYDTVLIAYPIWWGEEPRIIDTFMESYDFTGKTMATFCTSGSSGIDTAERNLHDLAPNSRWLGAKRFQTGADMETVRAWLDEIGIVFENNKEESIMMRLEIGDSVLFADFADTDAASALRDELKAGSMTIDVSNYGGWEKVGSLPGYLPANDEQITAQPGDIMLYSGNSIVLFYGSNNWSYTPLGKIVNCDAEKLREALSGSESQLTISLAE